MLKGSDLKSKKRRMMEKGNYLYANGISPNEYEAWKKENKM